MQAFEIIVEYIYQPSSSRGSHTQNMTLRTLRKYVKRLLHNFVNSIVALFLSTSKQERKTKIQASGRLLGYCRKDADHKVNTTQKIGESE